MTLHPVLRAAASGVLPPWSSAGEARRAHMARVADLMERWARKAELPEEEEARWRAAGFLHDALRDGDPARLRAMVPDELRNLPDPMVHGPAVASVLRGDGVADEPFLLALAYHTIGHPRLDRLGRSLYAADFLESGRPFGAEWRAGLRERMPEEAGSVVPEVARARITALLEGHHPIRLETAGFWNALVEERHDG